MITHSRRHRRPANTTEETHLIRVPGWDGNGWLPALFGVGAALVLLVVCTVVAPFALVVFS